MKRTIGVGIAVWLGLAFAHAAWADDDRDGRGIQYAVKFACGFNDTTTAQFRHQGPAFGHYSTIVNIHNPSRKAITFKRKVAVTFTNGDVGKFFQSGDVSEFDTHTLAGDHAEGILCSKIKKILGILEGEGTTGGLLEGFLVIITPKELDVTALYTGEQCRPSNPPDVCDQLGLKPGVTTMAVQVIAPRKHSDSD